MPAEPAQTSPIPATAAAVADGQGPPAKGGDAFAAHNIEGAALPPPQAAQRTLWGLTTAELHDRFWASRGIQVVRLGQRFQIVDSADLYLLIDPRLLCVFAPARLAERLYWADARLMMVRLQDQRRAPYVERVVADEAGNFIRFDRVYARTDTRLARVALTSDRAIADAWQTSRSTRQGWRTIRQLAGRTRRLVDHVPAPVFDAQGSDLTGFMRHLQGTWSRPDATVERCTEFAPDVWIDPSTSLHHAAVIDGRAWIGAGRVLRATDTVLGPAVLWDRPEARPTVTAVRWRELQPTEASYRQAVGRARRVSWLGRSAKRGFDILFAALVLLLTLPFYPLVMLAIWLEDGRPFLFGHLRETVGGSEFRCWKFRSMRKDAEQIKQKLLQTNQADGPQFFIKNDPRLTRVGRIIRKLNIDELPQFFNVLLGQMSVVGPRPSPRRENQFCPPWREARLSVRPGITGLWQIMRTRRPGMDFQEWIKYDLEYVQNVGLKTDLWILKHTIYLMLKGKL